MFTFKKYQTFPEWIKGIHSQTAVKDADIKDGVNMSTNGTLVSKSASMWDESYGKAFEDYSNSEIAREIIINALYDAVVKHQGTYNNYYLQQVENDYGDSRAVAVRKKMVQYIGRIFKKYHTAKFDMSGHPILHDVFHKFEKHGELKFF